MDNKKIETMNKAGLILGDVLSYVLSQIKPGISEIEIDRLAEKEILKRGGEPGFKKVPGYSYTICISTNDVVVHGIPTKRTLKSGDIVGIDCGVYLDGYHTDMAETIVVKEKNDKVNPKVSKFLKIGKEAMFAGIKKAKPGNRVGDISLAMQKTMEGAGYSVVRNLVGHGVGKQLHEFPEIPGYLSKKIERTPLLKTGMTIAIEAIYNMGGKQVSYVEDDDWTIVSSDGSLSGLFERTLLVGESGPVLITKLPGDKI